MGSATCDSVPSEIVSLISSPLLFLSVAPGTRLLLTSIQFLDWACCLGAWKRQNRKGVKNIF